MSIFRDIQLNYGRETLKLVRECETVTKKHARYRNHLVFTLRCKQTNITPNSLWLRCPIRTNRAADITSGAERSLLSERVRVINNKLSWLDSQRTTLESSIGQVLSEDDKVSVFSHLSATKDKEFTYYRENQMKKFERLTIRLGQRGGSKDNVDLSGEQLKKWVVNISKYKLSESETSVLAKG